MKKRFTGLFLSLLILLLTVSGCGQDAGGGSAGAHDTDISRELVYEDSMELLYAEKFAVDYYTGGFSLVTINGNERYLVVPEGSEAPGDLDGDITVLYQPLDEIYLVASAVMDMFISMDALDTLSFTGTKADGWYLEIPESWRNMITISRNDQVTGQREVIVSRWMGEDQEPEPFLSIYRISSSRGAQVTENGWFLLREEENVIYAAEFRGDWDCGLDEQELRDRVKTIQTSWYYE